MAKNLNAVTLQRHIQAAGFWGPAVIIAFMVLAIVFTPIPSAPVAISAGALYGHTWGTVYVVAGAELGAILAYSLARYFGHSVLRRYFGDKLDVGLLGSQNFLMGTVFITRILPFVSFDIVSYAAGLSPLTFWRFSIATLAGIIPASFLLAHFGSEISSTEPSRTALAVLGLGLMTTIPLVAAWIWKKCSGTKK
jgi:uncharacterized membrane protein YdjX (TVP38/TMEM64 family)